MNPYTSIWTGVAPGDGPQEFHLVFLDNGRTKVLANRTGRQTLQCIVERDQLGRPLIGENESLVEREVAHTSTALVCSPRARVFDQYLAHQLSRNPVKMLSALPFREVLLHEPKEGLIDERGGLEAPAFRLRGENRDGGTFDLEPAPGEHAVTLLP